MADEPQEQQQQPPDDVGKRFDAMLAKFGNDGIALARDAFGKAERYRSERDEARGKVPREGARVLSADEATAFVAFRALKLKPDEIAAKVAAGDEAVTWRAARERKDLIAAAAKAHGYDADVLEQLAGPDLAIELKDATRNGKPAKVARVVGKDEAGEEVRVDLDKHAEKAWAKFLPSLKVNAPAPVPGNAPRRPPVAPPEINTDAPRPRLAGL